MNFTWKTPKHEVLDSVRSWGFSYNAEKTRWDRGTLNGYKCRKLKVWFNADSLLEGVEAKYQDIDSATAREIFDRYESQTRSEHGDADEHFKVEGAETMERASWQFSPDDADTHDMIVIDGFTNYVLFHAARNMPLPIELAPSSGE